MKTSTVARPTALAKRPANWADAIAARVNTFGLGPWLGEAGAWLGLAGTAWLPRSPADGRRDVPVPGRAVLLRLHALPSFTQAPVKFRGNHIVLAEAAFSGRVVREHPETCALPFGLDAHGETPATASAKLGYEDTFTGRGELAHCISWYLDDARVVELSFGPGMKGIERVWIVRLGQAVPYSPRR